MDLKNIGVAISTTGDEHRMAFLETCVKAWKKAIPLGGVLVVTVDGTEEDAQRVSDRIYPLLNNGGVIFRVGQPTEDYITRDGRLGVAVNKNTGLEFLMESGVEHLFLSDDDTWPLFNWSLEKHTTLDIPHSMVCWGKSRLTGVNKSRSGTVAEWNWPRGVLLYVRRWVVEGLGGMDERFGPGGHEHVEWSRRIFQAGLTPVEFPSPAVYAERGVAGPAMRAGSLWHCEDMRRPGEAGGTWTSRKRKNTSVRRKGSDWDHIQKIMAERDGDTSFVPFRALDNGRASATLCSSSTCAAEPVAAPKTPRSEK